MGKRSGQTSVIGAIARRCWFGRATAILLGALLSGPLAIAHADAPGPSEDEVKAAVLYKFAKFVEWPEGAFADGQSPTGVCVLGSDGVFRALGSLSEQSVKGRRTAVRRLDEWSFSSEGCHIMFIGELKPYQLAASLKDLEGQPILTVGDAPGFAKRGGMLGLNTVDKKIRFEINLDAAEEAKLVISSQVLNLATVLVRQNR